MNRQDHNGNCLSILTRYVVVSLLLYLINFIECPVFSADATISYSDLSGKKYNIPFVFCPTGKLIQVKDYQPVDSSPVEKFLIAKEELSADHYTRLVEISKKDKEPWELPSLKELLDRYVTLRGPSKKGDKEKFKKTVYEKYGMTKGKSPSKLPVFALTFEEAERTCLVLQHALCKQNPNITAIIIEKVTLPTDNQWQYAVRAADLMIPQEHLHFPSWPSPAEVKAYADKKKIRKQLRADANDGYSFMMSEKLEFPDSDQIKPIDISTSADILIALEKCEQLIVSDEWKKIKGEKIITVLKSQGVLIYRLLEILRCTAKKPVEVPVAFGKPIADSLLDRPYRTYQKKITFQNEFNLLRLADDTHSSILNHWGLLHTLGNVREWTVSSKGKPVIGGCSVFDQNTDWSRSLIWNMDRNIFTGGEKSTRKQKQIKELAGIRLAVTIRTKNSK